jgi:hypothetical protein
MRNRTTIVKRRYGGILAAGVAIAVAALLMETGPASSADPPPDVDLIRPLPVITPTASNWAPKYPDPYDQTRDRVTAADITAEGQMCQWFTAQYDILNDQIGRLQFNRIAPNGTDFDYSRDGVQQQVDIVTGNIDQAVDFLAPRAQALTQSQDFAGDVYFPIYKGDAFYGLWQQLSNVNDGIKAHQPDWFTGPSYLRMKKWASEVHRAHVCD